MAEPYVIIGSSNGYVAGHASTIDTINLVQNQANKIGGTAPCQFSKT